MYFNSFQHYIESHPQEALKLLSRYTFEIYNSGIDNWRIDIKSHTDPRFEIHHRVESLFSEGVVPFSANGIAFDYAITLVSNSVFDPDYLFSQIVSLASYFDRNKVYYRKPGLSFESAQNHPSFLFGKRYFKVSPTQVLSIET